MDLLRQAISDARREGFINAVCTRDCQILESARRNRDVANYDLYAQTALGDRRWLNISIIVAHVKQGPSPLVVHLMRDIGPR